MELSGKTLYIDGDGNQTLSDAPPPPARTCENCACYHIQENSLNPMEKQAFCRRDPVNSQRARMERPRMKRDGSGPVLGRDDKPVMEAFEGYVFLYRPTLPNLTCFDGWRPAGTLPGDKWQNAALDKVIPMALAWVERGMGAIVSGSPAGDFQCPHGKSSALDCADCLGAVEIKPPSKLD